MENFWGYTHQDPMHSTAGSEPRWVLAFAFYLEQPDETQCKIRSYYM